MKRDLALDPPIHFQNGRTLRTIGDAIQLLRDHETRPGVDDRDEVLHQLERAGTEPECAAAVARFRAWAESGGLLPVELRPGSTQGPAT